MNHILDSLLKKPPSTTLKLRTPNTKSRPSPSIPSTSTDHSDLVPTITVSAGVPSITISGSTPSKPSSSLTPPYDGPRIRRDEPNLTQNRPQNRKVRAQIPVSTFNRVTESPPPGKPNVKTIKRLSDVELDSLVQLLRNQISFEEPLYTLIQPSLSLMEKNLARIPPEFHDYEKLLSIENPSSELVDFVKKWTIFTKRDVYVHLFNVQQLLISRLSSLPRKQIIQKKWIELLNQSIKEVTTLDSLIQKKIIKILETQLQLNKRLYIILKTFLSIPVSSPSFLDLEYSQRLLRIQEAISIWNVTLSSLTSMTTTTQTTTPK